MCTSLLCRRFARHTTVHTHRRRMQLPGKQHLHMLCVWREKAAELLEDLEAMNARLRSEWGGFGIMAQSQAIFDCCGGNPPLLFPLPGGDNAFAVLPSCTYNQGWDAGPCQKKKSRHYVSLSSVCLRVERHFLKSAESENKIELWTHRSDFTVSLLTLIPSVFKG